MAKKEPLPIHPVINIVEVDGKYHIRTPYQAEVAALLKGMRGSHWDANKKVWWTSTRNHKAVVATLVDIIAVLDRARGAADSARDYVAAHIAQMQAPHVSIDRVDDTLRVMMPYHSAAVAQLKTLGGKWSTDTKRWLLPISAAEALHQAVPELSRLAVAANVARQAEAAERQRERAALAAERQAAKADQIRWLYPLAEIPAIGQTVKLNDAWCVVTGHGRTVRITEDDPSCWGSYLLGREGDRAAMAYMRHATPEEAAAADVARTAALERQARRSAAKKDLDALTAMAERDGERPTQVEAIKGETIAEQQMHLSAYGSGSYWVLADDTLWYIRRNGADGDNWSYNNYGSSIAYKVPRDDAIITRLRECASALKG